MRGRAKHAEIHIHYGDGMADSKLKVPAAKSGTRRNMNTIARLAAMVAGAEAQSSWTAAVAAICW